MRSRAFTLVELLVVISIISLLIAMLLPSLGNSKQVAKMLQCASGMRQVHIAGASYAESNRGYLPVGAGPSASNWAPTWDQLLLSYGATHDLLRCPNHDKGSRHMWVNSNYINAYKAWGNTSQTGVMSLGFSVRLDSLRKPSNTVSWMELREHDAAFAFGGISEPGSGWASICWDYQDYFILRYAHLGLANFAHCDGHVESLDQDRALGPKDSGGVYTLQRMRRQQ